MVLAAIGMALAAGNKVGSMVLVAFSATVSGRCFFFFVAIALVMAIAPPVVV